MSESNNIDKNIQVEVGTRFYHWRYGAMMVTDIEDEYIILEVEDCDGIKQDAKLLDPWRGHLMEKTKKFPKAAIDKWVFKVPEMVGSSKPAYGDRMFLSDELFLRKLNSAFNEELVMECKNNFAQYIVKAKAEKMNKDVQGEKENDSEINAKEIDELVKTKEDYIIRKDKKEEELAYIVNKYLDYEIQISNLEGNILKYKRKISEKEKRIVAKENELEKLKNEVTTNVFNKNQGMLIDLEAEIRRLEEGIDELKGEINEAGRNMEKIGKDLIILENKKNLLNKQISELTTKIENLEKDIKVLT